MKGNEFGQMVAARMGQTAFEKSRLFRAKVTSVTNRATVGIKCEIESTGETVYVEAAGAATVYEIAVNDYVWVKRLTDGQRNSWILAGFAEDSGGSHVPSLRDEIGKISELWASDGDPQAVDVDAAGIISVLKDLQLDDGVGNSPALKVIGGTNDDTFSIYLDDDAVAGKSELVIKMCGAGGNSCVSLYDSTLTKFLTINSAGHVILMDDVGAALVIRDIGGNDDYLTFVTTNAQREVVINQDGADIDLRVEGSTVANLLHVDAGGNLVGIGGSPAVHFHVFSQGNADIRIESASGFSRSTFQLRQHDASNNNDYFSFSIRGDVGPDVITFVRDVSSGAYHNMLLFNYLTDKIRLYGKTGFDCVPNSITEWNLATENLEFVDAGSAAATEQDWIQVEVGGVTGYIRVYAAK